MEQLYWEHYGDEIIELSRQKLRSDNDFGVLILCGTTAELWPRLPHFLDFYTTN
jgi:hypothetical protein